MPPHGLNRLERFFSMRKSSSTPNHASRETLERFDNTENPTTTFPQPSFIRPRSARMEARDESATCSRSANRPSSVPEARFDRAPMHSPNPSAASTGDIHGPPTRSTTLRRLGAGRKEKEMHSAIHFQEFRFPAPPRRSTEKPPTSPAMSSLSPSTPISKSFPSQKRPIEHRHSFITLVRTVTPPASDNEDERNARDAQDRPNVPHMQPGHPVMALPTPETSPEIKPVPDSPAHEPRRDSGLRLATNSGGLFCPSRRKRHKAELRKARSQACISARAQRSSSKVLKGGNVKDFFSLSDDDIAEEELEAGADEQTAGMPHAMERFAPLSEMNNAVTITSPSHNKNKTSKGFMNPLEDAAAYGAVQIAKIAAKHKFDMAYIINLWPENPRYPPPSGCARSSMLGSSDDFVVETAAGMTGRLLAAYGLSKVASPFCISAAVHAKILRHTGWIEYRAADARPGEFSRGYGHAFHAGTTMRRSLADPVAQKTSSPATTEGTTDVSDMGRGIVFVAYRQLGPDGITKECPPAGLAALRADVEHLIDMLMAIHKATRLRNPAALGALANDVVPMSPVAEGGRACLRGIPF
ncbi:hypothetical protein ACRALDRAFT_2025185 [Sodiomyces alcalophilus JCM 7366]|uniref:uncharacterized protein n=1 Tax=Sodiomyces alcalophilus JCM 7366 TaxID=591952 RepID=UPI0039B3D528